MRRSLPMLARGAAGTLCLIEGARRGGKRDDGAPHADRLDRDAAVVLGARYLLQGLGLDLGYGTGLRWRISVELLHALSMGAVAAAIPRHRRRALEALRLAAVVMALDLASSATTTVRPSQPRARPIAEAR